MVPSLAFSSAHLACSEPLSQVVVWRAAWGQAPEDVDPRGQGSSGTLADEAVLMVGREPQHESAATTRGEGDGSGRYRIVT
jgi:hypothetical protein